MSHSLGVAIESLVAILLMLTIGYCMLLNKRLKRLKADEQSLKATIGELITATEIAERAIGGLKHTVRDVNENLGTQLASADRNVGAVEETTERMRQRGPPLVEDRGRGPSSGSRARTGAAACARARFSLERQGGRSRRAGFLRTQKG